jgi:DNA helicase-2/ATP-dependent DNA helicase PcrA
LHPLLAHLNPEQRAAVEAAEGPLLILAGAGSGKTRVITHRIAWLIQEKGIAPDSILAVTFTNKAAGEMAERVNHLLGHSSLAKPLIATFHSFCVRILRRDIEALKTPAGGLTRAFTIFDDNDQLALLKQIMKRMGLDTKQLTPRTVQGRISWAKNHMVDPQDYFLSSKDPTSERIAHIFKAYQSELRKNNAVDFDDLLLEAAHLLKASSEVRERYQRRYQYVLVDEYQDTNRPQYELMKLLAGERKNVCAVGDEDQSIYSWRGADIRNILEFEQDFPDARIIRLEQNYRSTQVILEAAGAVVANNLRRKGKKLWTDRQGGSLIGYYEAPDSENEALFIANKIQAFLRAQHSSETEGPGEGHCAVLYRLNSQSRLIEEAMRRHNISYSMVGGFSFYERAEIKDLLCYLRLVKNPHDSMALGRVINTPARGIGKTTLETIERLALETGRSTWDAVAQAIANRLIPTRALMALESFRQLILDAQAMMDPDFAGKLAADVAESAASDSDTAFGFGAKSREQGNEGTRERETWEPGSKEAREQEGSRQEDAEAHFGGDQNQMPLLNASHFSPAGDEIEETSGSDQESSWRHLDSSTNPSEAQEVSGHDFSGAANEANLTGASAPGGNPGSSDADQNAEARSAFRAPGDSATLPELIRFIIDRSGYIKALETEGTPEAFSRIENLKELANAAHDAEERGETLAEFLDHAALASDADQFDPNARVTLMTLHAAKGLEFPLVFLAGLEEGLFPLSRSLSSPEDLEEERRLCYVGMTRAMNTLILTRAHYRRRYGADTPEGSVPSRFLAEVPGQLIENLGAGGAGSSRAGAGSWGQRPGWSTPAYAAGRRHSGASQGSHFNYEDESQELPHSFASNRSPEPGARENNPKAAPGPEHSINNIARFFGAKSGTARPGSYARPAMNIPESNGASGLKKGQRVFHAKYGEGTVLLREGGGEDAKLTVLFARHGMKKLMEKFANLKKL